MTALRFHGATLVDADGERQADLLVKNGKILGEVSPDLVTEDFEAVGAEGLFLAPGFCDVHQHGGGGGDYMDGTTDAYLQAARAHVCHGTTLILPTLLSADGEGTLRAIAAYLRAKNDPRLPLLLGGLHLEGPYLSPAYAGAQKPENIRAFDREEYTRLYAAAEGEIRRWSVAPEVEGAAEFARFAAQNGILLSIAHSGADADEVRRAVDLGFSHVTHLYSCMSTVTRRGGFRVAGVLEMAYLLDALSVEVIADGCHLPPDLLAYVAKCKPHEKISLVTDAMRAAGEDAKESFLGSPRDPLPVIVEDGVAKLCDRSAFAGSVATQDRLLRNMLAVGVSLSDGVAMLTRNPIREHLPQAKKGMLSAGYDADLCLFDRDVDVKAVYVGGEVRFRA
jgi:N-acetylglucosamine-6-phosphate deacetylase